MAAIYHRFMAWYYGWRVKRLVRRLRLLGDRRGLPSLGRWSDEEVVEGFRRMMKGG